MSSEQLLQTALLTAKSLLQEIKENEVRLNKCAKHNFGRLADEKRFFFNYKMRCINCNGEMRLHDIELYVKGFMAAGGNPDEVIQNLIINQTNLCASAALREDNESTTEDTKSTEEEP